MFKQLISMAVIALAVGTTLANAQARPTAPMTSQASTQQYNFSPYGSILLEAMVREVGGKTAVCGIWTVNERLQA